MLRNYLKVAWRNIVAQKTFSIVNLLGLAIAMAASAVIFFWVKDELEFDAFFPKIDRISEVYNRDRVNGEFTAWNSSPEVLAPELKASFPDIEDAVRFISPTLLVTANEKNLNLQGAFADPGMLTMFDFQTISQKNGELLADAQSVVVTRSFAEKMFGSVHVTGKVLSVEHKDYMTITGVIEDLPLNSRFAGLHYILPWKYYETLGWGSSDWSSNWVSTFVLARKDANIDDLSHKISRVTAKHLKEKLSDVTNRSIFLHPAKKWHLYSKIENGQLVAGQINQVATFATIGILILLVACINFINLSTAAGERRAKEVGVRKAVGAHRHALTFQFLCESFVLVFAAAALAVLLVVTALPFVNQLTDKQIEIPLNSWPFWLTALSFIAFTGLAAGTYPALFLSGFTPSGIFRGAVKPASRGFSLRKGLVVLQFSFAVVLIISTLVVKKQVNFALTRESGFDRDQLIFVALSGTLDTKFDLVRSELIDKGIANSATRSLGPATSVNTRQWGVSWQDSDEKARDVEFNLFGADADFIATTGTRLMAGREIDIRKFPTDSNSVLLNETAVKTMKLPNPVGTTIKYQKRERKVVGVVGDFIFDSPYQPVKPVIIEGPAGLMPHQWASIRLSGSKPTSELLKEAETVFKNVNPEYPFEFQFADDTYMAKFKRETQTGTLVSLFSGLTVFISCLGLFGLSTLMAESRTKEIAIRKALGASILNIAHLFTGGFVRLVAFAYLVGAPVAWFVMSSWLQTFPYRAQMDGWMFAFVAFGVVTISLLTVGSHALRVAMTNPVKSLRSE